MKPDTHRPCVSCQLSPELYRLVTERAKRLEMSRAAVVRELLEDYFMAAGPVSPGRSWELDADHEREPSR